MRLDAALYYVDPWSSDGGNVLQEIGGCSEPEFLWKVPSPCPSVVCEPSDSTGARVCDIDVCRQPVRYEIHADPFSGFLEERQHEVEVFDAIMVGFDASTIFCSPHEVPQPASIPR